MNHLIIATRGSKLALWQSNHIKNVLEQAYEGLQVELKIFKTTGDKILDTPLALIGGKGLFTKELEEAMLAGDAHIAVHSLKDVPTVFPDGLVLGAVTKREDPRDAMLSQNYATIDDLPQGAIVGTTSLRRRMQLLAYRPDLMIKDLRGNVDTRIGKLKNGEFDAIILATAGMNRLGLTQEVAYCTPISLDVMIPAMGQAALGIEAVNHPDVLKIISILNDDQAMRETTIERQFVDTLEGGCQVPIGVHASMDGDMIDVRAIVGMPDGSESLIHSQRIARDSYEGVGSTMANELIAKGAKELLKKAEAIAFK